MKKQAPRVVGALVGDVARKPSAQTKYGLLFDALSQRFPLVGIYDASLCGRDRMLNALRVFNPRPQKWREQFYKNIPAFYTRSQRTAEYMSRLGNQVDVILQVNVLFDARWGKSPPPSVIYTDYTARLSAQRLSAGRSPFTPQQREEWIALERTTFERAAYICTRSRLVYESIVSDYGIPPERVAVIGGGVNFAPLPEPVPHAETDAPTVLFIGKELYRKGGDILLRAFARARRVVPRARLLLLTQDRIPAHLPLEGVQVAKPTWERRKIAALYQQADIFVLPSRLDTWGDVLLEAMCYGLPCVGVSGQPMEEIIEHERTGLLVPVEDVAALANALIRLFTDSHLRRNWGHSGRLRAEREYVWERVVDRLACILEEAASSKKRG